MARGDLPALTRLDIADDPAVWTALGFTVGAGGMVRVGSVVLRLTGAGRGSGITGWAMGGGAGLPSTVDGITTESHQAPEAAGVTHANGASHVDHVVVATPDIGRTLGALGALGLQVSRTRASGQSGPRARQAFLWSGDVILEVVGPQAADGDGPSYLRIVFA